VTFGAEDKLGPNQNLKNVAAAVVAAVVVGVAAAAVVAVAAVVVAVVVVDAVVVDVDAVDVERSVRFQDWMQTEEISSKDEILSRRPRQREVAEIWSSACCTARPALREGSRAGRDDPEKGQKQKKMRVRTQTVNLHRQERI
jgi:hypothetical protein